MTNKAVKILFFIIILIILAAAAYWYFFMRGTDADFFADPTSSQTGFTPIGRTTPPLNVGGNTTTNNRAGSTTPSGVSGTQLKIPALRLLSNTPVGGYGASTTGPVNARPASTTTVFRWVDRGRGNTFEARANTSDIITLSNTVVPKVYDSGWNKNLTGFFGLAFSEDNTSVSTLLAQLKTRVLPKISSTTPAGTVSAADSQTHYELKGRILPDSVVSYAISPKKDRVFLYVNEGGSGVGYTMNFDGTAAVQIFTTPLTQVNVDWPSDAVIAVTTKGSSAEGGFLYFVDAKTGSWKKILGPLPGLSTKVSRDAKRIFISATGNSNTIVSSIYDITQNKGVGAVVRTLADKCVWGNFYKEMVYCAVPSQPVPGAYPEAWYKGDVSFIDKLWQVNAATGEVHLVSSIIDSSDRVIDAFNLGLDEKDNFLIFMNKNDLSLWSLDLVSKN